MASEMWVTGIFMSSLVTESDFMAGWLIVFAGQSPCSIALALMTLPVILSQVIINQFFDIDHLYLGWPITLGG